MGPKWICLGTMSIYPSIVKNLRVGGRWAKETYANQKKDTVSNGAAIIAARNLYSGGTGSGANSSTFRI